MRYDAVLEGLERETERLVGALGDLTESEADRPTRCEPWTVRDLLAHLLVACRRLPGMLDEPAPPRAEVSALQYFRNDRLGDRFDPERVGAARKDATRFATAPVLVEALASTGRENLAGGNRAAGSRRKRARTQSQGAARW